MHAKIEVNVPGRSSINLDIAKTIETIAEMIWQVLDLIFSVTSMVAMVSASHQKMIQGLL